MLLTVSNKAIDTIGPPVPAEENHLRVAKDRKRWTARSPAGSARWQDWGKPATGAGQAEQSW